LFLRQPWQELSRGSTFVFCFYVSLGRNCPGGQPLFFVFTSALAGTVQGVNLCFLFLRQPWQELGREKQKTKADPLE
jgi:hypothetical protein